MKKNISHQIICTTILHTVFKHRYHHHHHHHHHHQQHQQQQQQQQQHTVQLQHPRQMILCFRMMKQHQDEDAMTQKLIKKTDTQHRSIYY